MNMELDDEELSFNSERDGQRQQDFSENFNYHKILIYANTCLIVVLALAVFYLHSQISATPSIYKKHHLFSRIEEFTEQENSLKDDSYDLEKAIASYEQLSEELVNKIQLLDKKLEKPDNEWLQGANEREAEAIDQQLSKINERLAKLQKRQVKSKNQSTIDILKAGREEKKNTISANLAPYLYNSKGMSIQSYLYPNSSQRQARIKLIQLRRQLFDDFMNRQPRLAIKNSLKLANYNLKLNHLRDNEQRGDEMSEYRRLVQKYHIEQFQGQELSFCVVGVGRNNRDTFRIQANLNSIFTQNYTNFYVVLIDDVSNDGSQQQYRKYFDFYEIPSQKYIFIANSERKTALENIDIAIRKHCGDHQIFTLVDLDDEIIGKNTLKLFNTAYLRGDLGMVYSNFYSNSNYTDIGMGFTKEYSHETMNRRSFREEGLKFSHLRSARISLYKRIQPADLQHWDGTFYKTFYDLAIFFPIIEMSSCGKVIRLDEMTYFYNYVTDFSDRTNTQFKRKQVHDKIIHGAVYECVEMESFARWNRK